jgi:hypothetical protein
MGVKVTQRKLLQVLDNLTPTILSLIIVINFVGTYSEI